MSEDNGAYVFTRPARLGRDAPAPEQLRVGMTTAVGGQPFSVAANMQVRLVSAQGELPKLPPLGQPFQVVELRSADGEVLSIDYGSQPPQVQRGRAVRLQDLRLTGLKEESARDEQGRQFNCPRCGAPVRVELASTKSCTCSSCDSIIDLSEGLGGELRHAAQYEPIQPLIPLGSAGQFEGAPWQVVGFQHRTGREAGDDESFGWEEYLLYNRQRGFVFLVDSTEGWSLLKPATGAPQVSLGGRADYLGKSYHLKERYQSQVEYVAGEFYWQVQRGATTYHREFASGKNLMSEETTQNEVTWSVGETLEASVVAKAFKMEEKGGAFKRADAAPFSSPPHLSVGTLVLLGVMVIFVLPMLLPRCSQCDPKVENCSASGSRTSGGSWGGFSGGGSHK